MARRDSPIGRILNLTAYVQQRAGTGCTRAQIAADVPGYSGLGDSALAKRLERDRKDLATGWGIRIEWSDDRQCYTLDPPYFTAKERVALIAAAVSVGVESGDDRGPLGEVGTAVEQEAARIVVTVHSRVLELRDAIAARQSIRIRYTGEERVIDPYVIGMWRNRWYLAGFDHLRDRRGKYRLDRIETTDGEPAVTPTGPAHAFEIPANYDAVAELAMDPNAWGADKPVRAVVRVARDQVPSFLGELDGTVGRVTEEDAQISVEVRDYESFIIRLLGFGTGVRLLAPPVLVDGLRVWLEGQVV